MLTFMIIGNRITEARKKVNISQAQLAEQLFISPQAVGKWERGESMPDIVTFNRLAEILGVDLNYFSESFQSAPSEVSNTETFDPKTEEQKRKPSWDMSRQNLVDTDFSGLKNLNERFKYTNMQRCQFIDSDLSGLLLKSNHIDSCDFSHSDISNSQMQSCFLLNNLFQDCILNETEFSKSYIEGCDFSRTDFTGVRFKSGGFGKNTVTDATWNRTSFNTSQISDVVFEGTLEDCFFENCGFTRVKFQNATILNTFFKNNRKLNKVQFIDCKADKITYAFLKNGKADLTGITVIS